VTVAVERRAFDHARDAHRHVFLTDGARLFEVVALRGFDATDPSRRPEGHAALKLIDARLRVPEQAVDELDAASWYPLASLKSMHVVDGARRDH